ncbi:hypothetical protein CRE_31190 [Caenorhabditis remanei]|uniref:Uncharacterized protein n=1 Tax=Caenorhabditis remanei TaxID=31234 RepID=E3MLH6_CAERE|nr:hypothetical protein CRE_31190 [Caenorhabditis remanei]
MKDKKESEKPAAEAEYDKDKEKEKDKENEKTAEGAAKKSSVARSSPVTRHRGGSRKRSSGARVGRLIAKTASSKADSKADTAATASWNKGNTTYGQHHVCNTKSRSIEFMTQRASAAISAEDGKISFTSICTPNGMMEQLGEWLCQF